MMLFERTNTHTDNVDVNEEVARCADAVHLIMTKHPVMRRGRRVLTVAFSSELRLIKQALAHWIVAEPVDRAVGAQLQRTSSYSCICLLRRTGAFRYERYLTIDS
jgi:hypothetical protein